MREIDRQLIQICFEQDYQKIPGILDAGANPDKCDCGYWSDSHDDLPRHRHHYSLADKVLLWRCHWQRETALAFQEMFPLV